jgi:amidohydrolase
MRSHLFSAAIFVSLFFALFGCFASPIGVDVTAKVDAVESQVIAWRRHIHQQPELSYQEVKTAAYVVDQLKRIGGFEIQTGLGKTGVKAVLRGGLPGPVIALRADMDALPVEERNELPFRSQAKAIWQGNETAVMHACGHDAHVAMLLGAAKVLADIRSNLAGTVVLLFQPAEEWGTVNGVPSGGPAMVADGAMNNPKIEAVFGQHINAQAPGGAIHYRKGGAMASGDSFTITVKGSGGHGAQPWATKDPIVVAAQIVTNLQSVVSRQVNLATGAAVLTVGQIAGGNRVNIIPETATIAGTIRALDEPTRVLLHASLSRMAKHTAEASGLVAEVLIEPGYQVLRNEPELAEKMVGALESAAGKDLVREGMPSMASEDFGAFASVAPGFFWFLNAPEQPDKPGAPNHSPLFRINEKYLKVGVRALVNVTLDYFGQR